MEWNEVKLSGDIFLVKAYMDKHPESECDDDIKAVYADLLNRESLMNFRRDIMGDVMRKSDVTAKEECTDVFFFGLNGTGKTSLLEGLMGCNGKECSFNFDIHGGPYANALFQLLERGLPPLYNPPFITTITGSIEERISSYKTINHAINLVELDGGSFYKRFVDCEDCRLEKLEILGNNNRKVFFIVIDPTFNKHCFPENCSRSLWMDQTACLSMFIELFDMAENKGLMKKVDAIHFIVTKADIFGDDENVRKQKACDIMVSKYKRPVEELIYYCRRQKRVNYATNFQPRIFTFSLGKFYHDNIFEYDSKDSLYLIDALRHMTYGRKEPTFLNKIFKSLAVVQPKRCDYGMEINLE